VSNKKPRLRAEDWGGGKKEGRIGDLRELDRSANKHEFSLAWVERLEDIQSAMLVKRAPRLLAVDLKAAEGEKGM
jgi:hypothetical protein